MKIQFTPSARHQHLEVVAFIRSDRPAASFGSFRIFPTAQLLSARIVSSVVLKWGSPGSSPFGMGHNRYKIQPRERSPHGRLQGPVAK